MSEETVEVSTVYAFRDGRIVRIRGFFDHAEALAAVRLAE